MSFWFQTIVAWLLGLFQPPTASPKDPGALPDTRPPEEKDKDYKIIELVGAGGFEKVSWGNKRWNEFRRFPVQNQDGSSSCVAQTMRKLLRILFKINRGMDLDFSAAYIYRKRSNYPSEGMIGIDALNIARDGVTLNALMASDNLSEAQMNAARIEQYHNDVAADFKLPYYVQFTPGNLEEVAGTIQKTGKGVMVWFFFTQEEWSRDIPTILDPNLTALTPGVIRHSVSAVDASRIVGTGTVDGQKGVFIEDSAHFGGKYERFITEDFYKKRNFFAAYPINFKFEPGGTNDPNKPVYNFKVDINYSPNYFTHPDVRALQDILKYEGLFPSNTTSTGYLGAITRNSLKSFQKKYLIPETGNLDAKTREVLNQIYK